MCDAYDELKVSAKNDRFFLSKTAVNYCISAAILEELVMKLTFDLSGFVSVSTTSILIIKHQDIQTTQNSSTTF